VNSPCPCGSGEKYKNCCQKFHKGALPKTAKELMRSRYSAFALNLPKYIIKTTHPKNQEFSTDTAAWLESIQQFSCNTEFKKLEVLEFIDGESVAYVTFKTTLFSNGEDCSFCEKSKFLKEENRWLYHSGEFL
jgi:SEC-C motif-containing protein